MSQGFYSSIGYYVVQFSICVPVPQIMKVHSPSGIEPATSCFLGERLEHCSNEPGLGLIVFFFDRNYFIINIV